jgi:hypothetical protein
MGDRIATMVIGMIQLDKIKKARSEAHIPMTSYGLLFFLSPIPNRKRDSGCTNIFLTGALPTVKGERQRLRKGFQRQLRGSAGVRSITASIGNSTYTLCLYGFIDKDAGWGILPVFESLSSVVEIRQSRKKYEVMRDGPLPCLYS